MDGGLMADPTVFAAQPDTGAAADDYEFLAEARRRMAYGLEADRENREADIDDRKFRAGEQWPEDVKQQRVNRPCLTINRTGQYVRQVTGDIRLNKPAINVVPAEDGDRMTADVYEGLIRHIEYASKAQRAYVAASEDQVVGGVGYFRLARDYASSDGWEQDIRIRHIRNPLSVVFDPDMQDPTGRDARWCFVYDDIPVEDYRAQFPGEEPASVGEPDSTVSSDDISRSWSAGDAKLVRIAEYWEVRQEQATLVLMSNGATLRDPEPQALAEAAQFGVVPIKSRPCLCPAVYVSLLDGRRVLSPPSKEPGDRIPIIRVVGEEVRVGARVVRHGLIRFMKDPQRMDNYWQSAMVERMALAPKAPFLVTPKHIEGFEADWRTLGSGNPNVLVYNPDPVVGRPERIAPAPIENGMMQLTLMAADAMKAVTGIYDASLGARSNETSGKAINARKEEGDVGTYVYADNLADAITECGRVIVSWVPSVYDTPRQIRILGKDMQPAVVQVNAAGGPDLTRGKYDVYVQAGPSFTSRRQQAAESMTNFVQAFPQAAPFLADLIAKNSDWPEADEVMQRMSLLVQAQLGPIMAQMQMQNPAPGIPAPGAVQPGMTGAQAGPPFPGA